LLHGLVESQESADLQRTSKGTEQRPSGWDREIAANQMGK